MTYIFSLIIAGCFLFSSHGFAQWNQAMQNRASDCVSQGSNFMGCFSNPARGHYVSLCVEERAPRCEPRSFEAFSGMSAEDIERVVAEQQASCLNGVERTCDSEVRAKHAELLAFQRMEAQERMPPREAACNPDDFECSTDISGRQTGVECTVIGQVDPDSGGTRVCNDGGIFVSLDSRFCSQFGANPNLDRATSQSCEAISGAGTTSGAEPVVDGGSRNPGGGPATSSPGSETTADGGAEPTPPGEVADNSGASGAAGNPGGAVGGEQPSAETTAEACEAAFNDAYDCCTNPMGCMLGGESTETADNVATGMSVITQTIGMVSGSGLLGMKKLCNLMNTAGTATAGINAAGAAVCASKKSNCSRVCRAAGAPANRCDSFNTEIGQQTSQAISSMLAVKLAGECSELASNNLEPGDIDFRVDCSDPKNASSPYCRDCNGPTAANNPFCRNQLAYDGGAQGSSGGAFSNSTGQDGTNFGSNDGDFHNVDTGDNLEEQEDFGQFAEASASSNGIGAGGGGGAPAGGSASLGSDSDGGSGSGAGGGYNTNVLKGAQGGGGYTGGATTSRVRYGSGGGGYNYGTGKSSGMKGIDLKKFLPGGSKNKARGRRLASLGGADSKIRKKEGNIFHTMTLKFRQMCQLKRLSDCPPSKKKRNSL